MGWAGEGFCAPHQCSSLESVATLTCEHFDDAWYVMIGHNQMFSCVHGCIMREEGAGQPECNEKCDRHGSSGCFPQVQGVTFDLCKKCDDGGGDEADQNVYSMPEGCRHGCDFYGSGSGNDNHNDSYSNTDDGDDWYESERQGCQCSVDRTWIEEYIHFLEGEPEFGGSCVVETGVGCVYCNPVDKGSWCYCEDLLTWTYCEAESSGSGSQELHHNGLPEELEAYRICENHGHSRNECESFGCCDYDPDGICYASVMTYEWFDDSFGR